jgi:hypothetical protein
VPGYHHALSCVQKIQSERLSPEMASAVQLRLAKMLMLEEIFEKVSSAAAAAAEEAGVRRVGEAVLPRDALRSLLKDLHTSQPSDAKGFG